METVELQQSEDGENRKLQFGIFKIQIRLEIKRKCSKVVDLHLYKRAIVNIRKTDIKLKNPSYIQQTHFSHFLLAKLKTHILALGLA